MVSSFGEYLPCWDEETIRLRGLIYETSSRVPKSVSLSTHRNKHSQEARPDLYHTMSNASTQAYIHDAVVVVRHSNKKDKFVVFIKHHQYLPANLAVAKLRGRRSQEPVWRGDVVVMKKSVHSDKLVNLVSKKDRALANFVVKRFTKEIQRRPKFRVPRKPLTFVK